MRRSVISCFTRKFSSSQVKCNGNHNPKICIVGAGPAGFYAAQHIIKHIPQAQVDIYERLPVPFGLVRFGVAPDHPEVKNVINTFTKTAEQKNVRFLGNINLGTDVFMKDLQTAYHSVLLTYGADENRRLNIPGEDLFNVHSARNIVGWYNGTPWDKNLKIDLSGDTAAIIGQGNVAVDVARILLTPVDDLKKTDITEYALEALSKSKIKKVYLIGRRGPLQAAYTIKELREMIKLAGLKTIFNEKDFQGVDELLGSLPRPKKRITELMLNTLKTPKTGNGLKDFIVKFCRSPVEFQQNADKTAVGGIKLSINTLKGEDYTKQEAVATEETEDLACQLAITSIGYKSIRADASIPFDPKKGVITNVNHTVDKDLYVSGWLATGPTGVILTTMSNAFATADTIVADLKSQLESLESKPGYDEISKILNTKNVHVIQWENWLKIDQHEQELGAKVGKPREKLVDIKKMLEVAL